MLALDEQAAKMNKFKRELSQCKKVDEMSEAIAEKVRNCVTQREVFITFLNKRMGLAETAN